MSISKRQDEELFLGSNIATKESRKDVIESWCILWKYQGCNSANIPTSHKDSTIRHLANFYLHLKKEKSASLEELGVLANITIYRVRQILSRHGKTLGIKQSKGIAVLRDN